MWFAAMGSAQNEPWFSVLIVKLLEGDKATIGLLAGNPFPDGRPRWVRARLYRYTFTTRAERKATGQWWNRELAEEYFPAVRLE
jgi:Lipase maturation factor